MWNWLAQHAALVQVAVAAITALVWLVYLQILVSGLRRQRRTEILIHLGGSKDTDARVIVSNLGFEPIYVLEIILSVWSGDGERDTSVADRTEIARQDLDSPLESTLQGPLKSGEFVDIGSFENLLQRARWSLSDDLDLSDLDRVEVKVAAITAARSSIVAAYRQFRIDQRADGARIRPETLSARQIRSWWGRNRLRRQLEARLDGDGSGRVG